MKSKYRTKQSLDHRIQLAHQAIENALNSTEIMAAINRYNYDEKRVKEGQTLLEKTKKLYEEKYIYDSDKLKATILLKEAAREAKAAYVEYLQFARLALKNQPEAALSLGLKGKRSRSLSGWIEEAKQFYFNALSDTKITARLSDFGITAEKLQAGKKLLDKVEQAAADQEKKKGMAVHATGERNRALNELDQWLVAFLYVCRCALKGEKEQLLESLGIVVPS